MASKKKVARRAVDKHRKEEFLVKLLLRAKVEVKKLLKRNEAGTITNVELDRELKQVAASVKRVLDYTSSTLDEVSLPVSATPSHPSIAEKKGNRRPVLAKARPIVASDPA